MSISRCIKILVFLAVTSLVSGCKVVLLVLPGGDVTGTQHCEALSVCEYPVTEETYSESFTAVPRPGYQFVRWQDGAHLLCGGSTNPTCTVSLPGNRLAAATIMALFDEGFLIPVFEHTGSDDEGEGEGEGDVVGDGVERDHEGGKDVAPDADDICPLNSDPECAIDSIFVNGREWAQPDLFAGISWADVDAVCPEGVCSGILTSSDNSWAYNLTGWTWSNAKAVEDFLNHYRGSAEIFGCPEIDLFLDDGWRAYRSSVNSISLDWVYGYVSDVSQDSYGVITAIGDDPYCGEADGPLTGYSVSTLSAWFYRDP